MRALVALLLCLWWPAHAGTCLHVTPRCQDLVVGEVVRGKIFFDPLLVADQQLSFAFTTANGATGTLDSVVVDGEAMYRVRLDQSSPVTLAAFTLTRPGQVQQQWARLDNAPGDLAFDWVLQDTLAPEDVSFAFANGLQPGQASFWMVDLLGGPAFGPVGLGVATDLPGGSSAAKPLLAPVPEPAGAALLAGGLVLVTLAARRRRG